MSVSSFENIHVHDTLTFVCAFSRIFNLCVCARGKETTDKTSNRIDGDGITTLVVVSITTFLKTTTSTAHLNRLRPTKQYTHTHTLSIVVQNDSQDTRPLVVVVVVSHIMCLWWCPRSKDNDSVVGIVHTGIGARRHCQAGLRD